MCEHTHQVSAGTCRTTQHPNLSMTVQDNKVPQNSEVTVKRHTQCCSWTFKLRQEIKIIHKKTQ
eukprot:JP442109.1.p1 GENE.JP442109.1~~JP442109.1.p1  ORF type:complete len:64 (+),score=0.25 JP442109.1:67-258(+)